MITILLTIAAVTIANFWIGSAVAARNAVNMDGPRYQKREEN